MRYLLSIILLLCLASCMTSKSLEMSPQHIQDSISEDELNLVGKQLRITTSDGVLHIVEVINVTETSIISQEREFLFADIIAIESSVVNLVGTGIIAAGIIQVVIVQSR